MSVLEERNAAWKVLLPVNLSGPVLTLGLTVGEISSLSRSFAKVDCLVGVDDGEGPLSFGDITSVRDLDLPSYVLVVIDSHWLKSSVFNSEIVPKLNPSTYLSVIGPYSTARAFFKAHQNFKWLGFWAFLPSESPRLICPLIPRLLRKKGLEFHAAGSRRSRFILKIIRFLSFLGFKKILKYRGVSIGGGVGREVMSDTLTCWLEKKLGGVVRGPIIYTGSDTIHRKISALYVSETHGDLILKLPDSPAAESAVMREAEALKSISDKKVSRFVPELLFLERYGNMLIQGQGFLQKPSKRQHPLLSSSHIQFLVSLVEGDVKLMPVRDTGTWQLVNEKRVDCEKLARPGVAALIDMIERQNLGSLVPCARVHGDFTPWNISYGNGSCVVWDWEDSIPNGLVFTDIFTFIYRQASLVGPWPGAERIYCSMSSSCAALSHAIGIDSNLYFKVSLKIWLINESLGDFNSFTEEMIMFLLGVGDDKTP